MFSRMGAPMPPPASLRQGAVAPSPIVHALPQVIDGRGEVSEIMGDVAFEPAPAPRVAPATRARMGRPALRR
jgi:hypothetical protein